MTELRGFKVVSRYRGHGIKLPTRSTKYSAGYDIRAAKDITVPSIDTQRKPTLVPTGLKTYMCNNEYLELENRSSNPLKRGLILANGIGIIDSDYYDNPSNEGELFGQFINISKKPYIIHKGDRIMQGIFKPYLVADSGNTNNKRKGGLGSTGK